MESALRARTRLRPSAPGRHGSRQLSFRKSYSRPLLRPVILLPPRIRGELAPVPPLPRLDAIGVGILCRATSLNVEDEIAGLGSAGPLPKEKGIGWGSERRIISLGGDLRLVLSGLSKTQAESLGDEDIRELRSEQQNALRVGVLRPSESLRGLLFEHPCDPLRWRIDGDSLAVAGRYFFATVVRNGHGEVTGTLGTYWEAPAEFNDAITNFSRVVAALGLASSNTCVLHSCATLGTGGRANLFFGLSGAGKSTLGGLAIEAGRRVLSDDLNTVDLDEAGDLPVQGYPWTGDHGPRSWTEVRSAPLAAIFRLEQADRHEVLPLRPAAALAGLAACSPFINAEPSRYVQLLANLELLLARVPAFTLRFRRDTDVWDHVDRVTG